MPSAPAPPAISIINRPADRLIVALDHPEASAALALVTALSGLVRRYKVGLELFTAAGPAVVTALRERGVAVFLDLKLHDIPETVARAVATAAALGVEMLTVHADGGREMLRRAAAAAREAGERGAAGAGKAPWPSGGEAPARPLVLGVTVLTSLELSDLAEVGVVGDSMTELVLARARLCEEAGLDGVICSPREVAALRAQVAPSFLLVSPGVRAAGADLGDQKRTGTAGQAVRDGADLLVVGRPVRQASSPRAAAQDFIDEIRGSGGPRP